MPRPPDASSEAEHRKRTPSAAVEALRGRRVLIVEDEPLAAMDLERIVYRLGAEPVGPVAGLSEASRLAVEAVLDAALLDAYLGGALVWPVARTLTARRVPVVFVTGYGQVPGLFPEDLRDLPVVAKPSTAEKIARALLAVLRPVL